jgi:outer membrane protein
MKLFPVRLNSPSRERRPFPVFFGIVLLLSVYGSVIGTWTFLGRESIGYIDSSQMLEKYKGAIAARQKFEEQSGSWNQNLHTLQVELTSLNQIVVNEGSKWNRKEVAEKNSEIKKKQQEYARYNSAVNDKSAKLENELMKPVLDELNAAIADFGKKKGYQIILGTLSGGNILYADKIMDLTDEFLEYANAR